MSRVNEIINEKLLHRFAIEHERKIAEKASEIVARYVLATGTERDGEVAGVFYSLEIPDTVGGILKLTVASVERHGRDLDAIKKGHNRNDGLSARVSGKITKPYVNHGGWEFVGKKLETVRSMSLDGYLQYYQMHTNDEILTAYGLYNSFISRVCQIVDLHKSGRQIPNLVSHFALAGTAPPS